MPGSYQTRNESNRLLGKSKLVKEGMNRRTRIFSC